MKPPEPAPGEDSWLSLALVNSRINRGGRMVDMLEGAGAVGWLREHALVADGTAVPKQGPSALRELRATVRKLLVARIDGSEPDPEDIGRLNRALLAVPGSPQLRFAGDRWERGWHPDGGDPIQRACAAIAADALDLLCGGTALGACAAPGCVRLLVRDHPRRHWCSARCGDRVRAARYYASHQTAGPA